MVMKRRTMVTSMAVEAAPTTAGPADTTKGLGAIIMPPPTSGGARILQGAWGVVASDIHAQERVQVAGRRPCVRSPCFDDAGLVCMHAHARGCTAARAHQGEGPMVRPELP